MQGWYLAGLLVIVTIIGSRIVFFYLPSRAVIVFLKQGLPPQSGSRGSGRSGRSWEARLRERRCSGTEEFLVEIKFMCFVTHEIVYT